MRGEYRTCGACERFCGELPPRARRIPEDILAGVVESGTTSACAENTQYQGTGRARCRNYLRVRGEYGSGVATVGCMMELPPRARRIQPFDSIEGFLRGTTSACAENTAGHDQPRPNTRNYLRVRGEYDEESSLVSSPTELPPRARRIRLVDALGGPWAGTTSACAENTRYHRLS